MTTNERLLTAKIETYFLLANGLDDNEKLEMANDLLLELLEHLSR